MSKEAAVTTCLIIFFLGYAGLMLLLFGCPNTP